LKPFINSYTPQQNSTQQKPIRSVRPDLDTASQGKTIEESLGNPKEAIELHLQDEEATTPQKKNTAIVTPVSVKNHAKTRTHLRKRK